MAQGPYAGGEVDLGVDGQDAQSASTPSQESVGQVAHGDSVDEDMRLATVHDDGDSPAGRGIGAKSNSLHAHECYSIRDNIKFICTVVRVIKFPIKLVPVSYQTYHVNGD